MTESLRTDELVQVFGHGDDSGARMGHYDEEVPHLRQILDPILSWGQDKWDRSRGSVCRGPASWLAAAANNTTIWHHLRRLAQTKLAAHPQ